MTHLHQTTKDKAMNTYHVFFKNEFQGEYKASCASVALDQWVREYQAHNIGVVYGNWPVVKRVSK